MLIHRSILRLIGAASSDPGHYPLSGVHVKQTDDDGGHIEACATDGKILAVVRHKVVEDSELPGNKVEGNSTEGCILSRHFVSNVSKFFGRRFARPVLEFFRFRHDSPTIEAEVIDDEMASLSISSREIDGKFPDYGSLVEDSESYDVDSTLVEVRLNPTYLIEAAKLIKSLAEDNGMPKDERSITMKIRVDNEGPVRRPVCLSYKNEDSVSRVLIMPLVKDGWEKEAKDSEATNDEALT